MWSTGRVKNRASRNNVVRKWLLLPIEIKAREYHSRLLMALHAVAEGCGAIIGRQANLKWDIERYPTGVYFDKSFDGDKLDWFRR
jgi:hypothetical protein